MSIETKIIFSGSNVVVGQFRCRSNNVLWGRENCTGSMPTIVFPRVAVQIRQAHRSPVVATPNHVMLYNAHQPYQRRLIDPRGDECEFFCVSGKLVIEAARSVGAPIRDTYDAPFEFSHAPCSSQLYLRQRALYQLLRSSRHFDPLFVEEYFLNLLPQIMASTYELHDPISRSQSEPCPFQREQVRVAKEYIARNYRQPLKIDEIAIEAECSAYHLCRLFKKFTGTTIHHFLLQHRLRSSIATLLDTSKPLIDIALDLGFSSHSHFTNAFRKTFGTSPSALRKSQSLSVLQAG